jgi:hypothetical protein
MREIDSALAKIEHDAQQRALDWAAAKYQLQKSSPSGAEAGAAQPGQPPAGKPGSIKSFLAQKRPENFYERVACLVYHLEKFDGKNEVGTKEIVKANSDARLSTLTNPAVFVKHATHTYGYLTSLGKRMFALSMRGEAVVDALPDRAKVEEAHNKFHFGKKGSKKDKKSGGRAK